MTEPPLTRSFARWQRAPRTTPTISDAYAIEHIEKRKSRITGSEWVMLGIVIGLVLGWLAGARFG